MTQGVFQVYRGRKESREPGPTFPSLREALLYVAQNKKKGPFDVLMPDGQWYGKQDTLRMVPGKPADSIPPVAVHAPPSTKKP